MFGHRLTGNTSSFIITSHGENGSRPQRPLYPRNNDRVHFILHKILYYYYYTVCQRFLDNPQADSRKTLHAGVLWFRMQWRRQRGVWEVQTLHTHRNRFFHCRKVTVIKYYNLSLTIRRIINSHNLRKTNHLGGGGATASMVECVLTWIREQYLVVCNIAK